MDGASICIADEGGIGEATSVYGLYIAGFRDLAMAELDKFVNQYGPISAEADYLTITMPCGEKVAYHTFQDLPKTDQPCTCGKPNCWFVKFDEG